MVVRTKDISVLILTLTRLPLSQGPILQGHTLITLRPLSPMDTVPHHSPLSLMVTLPHRSLLGPMDTNPIHHSLISLYTNLVETTPFIHLPHPEELSSD